MATEDIGFDDDFMAMMLGDFLDESQEYLSRLNENLLLLDELVGTPEDSAGTPIDPEVLNEMFRDAHSLKGLSAMLQLDDINRLTHRIENIFDAARDGRLDLSREAIDLTFNALDRLTQMVERLTESEMEGIEYESVVGEIQRLLDSSGAIGSPCATTDETPLGTSAAAAPGGGDQQSVDVVVDDPFADVVDDNDIPEKYLSLFIAETEESLDALSEMLVADDEIEVNPLLVICHRIKGAAASIGLNRAAKTAHAMEDQLQQLRETGTSLSATLIDAMLAAIDALREFVQQLKTNSRRSDRFAEVYRLLRNFSNEKPTAAIPPGAAASPGKAELHDEDRRRIALHCPANRPALAGIVLLDPDLPLASIKARLICDRLASLGELFDTVPSESTIDQLDRVTSLQFGLATNRSKDEVAAEIDVEGVWAIEIEDVVAEPPEAAATPPQRPTAPSKPPSRSADRPAETVRVDIDRLDQLMNLTGQLVISKARFAQLCEQLKELTTRKQAFHSLMTLDSRLTTVLSGVSDADCPELHSLRSHVTGIQGDLDMIRHSIEQLMQSRPIINELAEAVHQLGRVSDGIQKSVMDTRMVPVGPLFSRFKRVIRDITRGNGKDIRLIIRGEKTELDKRMIDELSDPLIHMVRNAADHGVESPEERVAEGKPAQGSVRLDAFHRGNQIYIQVTDDGRGLDPDKLRAKAVEKGIISLQDAERLTDTQALKLIWEPGFSTAEQVTEVSGRGMGMDIVRSKIERLNGTIELDSKLGEGTTISIMLPLTMAILPSLLTVIREDVFAIPIESVIEIVRTENGDLSTVRGVRAARVRGRIVPIVELEQLLNWSSANDRPAEKRGEWTLVIVGSANNEIGLAVQDVLGEEDIVIKSLAENYRNVEGLAGASILGNGRVSLILDVPTLVELAGRRQSMPAPNETLVRTEAVGS